MTHFFHTLCVAFTLIFFSFTSAIPAFPDLLDEEQLAVRIERLVDSLMDLEENGTSGEMIALMLEFKQEVESVTGVPILVDEILEQIQKSVKLPADQYSYLEQLINQGAEHHANNPGDDMNMTNITHVVIPTKVVLGVTIAICGGIVYFLPVPSSKVWGQKLVTMGVEMAVEGDA